MFQSSGSPRWTKAVARSCLTPWQRSCTTSPPLMIPTACFQPWEQTWPRMEVRHSKLHSISLSWATRQQQQQQIPSGRVKLFCSEEKYKIWSQIMIDKHKLLYLLNTKLVPECCKCLKFFDTRELYKMPCNEVQLFRVKLKTCKTKMTF